MFDKTTVMVGGGGEACTMPRMGIGDTQQQGLAEQAIDPLSPPLTPLDLTKLNMYRTDQIFVQATIQPQLAIK